MTNNNILQEVKPTKSRAIPESLDLAHAVAFFFHDELAGLISDLQNSDSLFVNFSLEEDEKKEIDKLEGEDLWNWLRKTGRDDVIKDLTYRQLTAAVLTDAVHFLCESLISCGKGKTTVAFSLLRKPLKENLLLLESICADYKDFIEKFHGESTKPYVLNWLSKERRLEIMNKAAEKVDLGGIDSDFLWTIRYAKEYDNSLETMWTKATHLVTSYQASATEPGNINFIFSSPTAIEEQWEHYYETVPFLLYYFLGVADEVASRFIEWNSKVRPVQLLLRHLAFLRFSEEKSDSEEVQNDLNEIFKAFEKIDFPCFECEKHFKLPKEEIDLLWLKERYICPECGESYNLWEVLLND